MPETTAPAATPPAPPAAGTPAAPASRETLGQRVGDFFHRAETDAAAIDAGLRAELTAHASQVLDVAGDALAVVKLIAPQDAGAAEAADAFIAKVLGMVQSATAIAGKALASRSNPS
jgi:hypothetical protein